SLKESMLTDGDELSMFDGGTAKISVKGGKISINGANVLAAVPASNGMVYVIDKVLLPPEKK
ncbi:MAG TPA: fasciclin domain-containing protein, partial [Leptospiraceae bacterium]|nr:fasciclin domain-containing protein [Leptospiraceae bacterium]